MAITAVPVGDSYVGTDIVSAGRFRDPLWRRNAVPFVWGAVGSHTLSAIDPQNDPSINADYPGLAIWRRYSDGGGSGSQQMIIVAWGGACYDRATDTLYLVDNGGHGDYGGNETYGINMRDDSPVFLMPVPPSGSKPYLDIEGIPSGATPYGNSFLLDDGIGAEQTGKYADGRPRSTHQYNKSVFVPTVGPVVSQLGSSFRGAQTSSLKPTWSLDLATKEWTNRVSFASANAFTGGNQSGACYVAENHSVYNLGSGLAKLSKLDVATWTWSQFAAGTQKNTGGTAKLIYTPDIPGKILQFDLSGMWIWDIYTGVRTAVTLLDVPLSILSHWGFDWCDRRGSVVMWPGLAGSTGTLYEITPTGNPLSDPWQCSVLATTGSPPAAHTNGTYGRFVYSPRLRGFIALASTLTPAYFLPLE